MQRTLKRELKVLEIVEREAFEVPIRSFFLKIATHLLCKFNSFLFGVSLFSMWSFKGEMMSKLSFLLFEGRMMRVEKSLWTNGCIFANK